MTYLQMSNLQFETRMRAYFDQQTPNYAKALKEAKKGAACFKVALSYEPYRFIAITTHSLKHALSLGAGLKGVIGGAYLAAAIASLTSLYSPSPDLLDWILQGGKKGLKLGLLYRAFKGIKSGITNGNKTFSVYFSNDYKAQLELVKSASYTTGWHEKANAISELVKWFFENSQDFEGCICPITKEIIVMPVQTPSGKCYEREAIIQWIKDAPAAQRDAQGRVTSPLRAEYLKESDLTFSLDKLKQISKKVNGMLSKINIQSIEGQDQPEPIKGLNQELKKLAQKIIDIERPILFPVLKQSSPDTPLTKYERSVLRPVFISIVQSLQVRNMDFINQLLLQDFIYNKSEDQEEAIGKWYTDNFLRVQLLETPKLDKP